MNVFTRLSIPPHPLVEVPKTVKLSDGKEDEGEKSCSGKRGLFLFDIISLEFSVCKIILSSMIP